MVTPFAFVSKPTQTCLGWLAYLTPSTACPTELFERKQLDFFKRHYVNNCIISYFKQYFCISTQSSIVKKTEDIYKPLCCKESFITQFLADATMGTKAFVFTQLQGFEVREISTSQAFQELLVHQYQHGKSKIDSYALHTLASFGAEDYYPLFLISFTAIT